MQNQKYGFFTAISMVVGIVIGSGIFFKADDILIATGGSVILGVLGFLVVGIGVLFGSLVISEYAINNPEEGGVIPFAKDAFGPNVAFFVSWFMIAVYFPALIVILAFVTSIYLSVLLGIDSSTFIYVATVVLLICAFVINITSKRLGGIIQTLATGLKLIPLFVIGFMGLMFWGNSGDVVSASSDAISNGGFMSALIAIAFTFDGWIIVTSIGGEIKNPKRTLPFALSFGVLFTVIIYSLYFIGITNIVSPSEIISLGDGHVDVAAKAIFGNSGSTIITSFVVIAVYGGLNGMVLAYLRLPHAIISQGMMKDVLNIEDELGNTGFAKRTIVFEAIIVAIVLAFHILVSEQILFGNLETPFDISTLPIIAIYIVYIGLYLKVFKVTKRTGNKRKVLALYFVLATLISLVVIYGALQVNGLLYIIVSLIIVALGYPLLNKSSN